MLRVLRSPISRVLNPFGENRWKFALQGAAVVPLGEKFTLNHAVGFSLIFAGAWFVFRGPF